MGLFDDVKNYWKSSPTWARLTWIVAAFLSSGSLASLSETVFQWKAFILDGVEYYRKIIDPFGKALEWTLSSSPSDVQLAIITIYGLFCATYRRFFIERFTRYGARSFLEALFLISVYVYNFAIWAAWVLFVSASVMGQLHFTLDIIAIVLTYIPIMFPLQIYTLEKFPEGSVPRKVIANILLLHFKNRKGTLFGMYYGPILFAVGAVFVLAAINSGLSRPYP